MHTLNIYKKLLFLSFTRSPAIFQLPTILRFVPPPVEPSPIIESLAMYRAFVVPFDSAVIMMFTLKDVSDWWHVLNDTPLWQDRIFYGLSFLYGLVSIVAMVIFMFYYRYCSYNLLNYLCCLCLRSFMVSF